jgi:hypothetical protein
MSKQPTDLEKPLRVVLRALRAGQQTSDSVAARLQNAGLMEQPIGQPRARARVAKLIRTLGDRVVSERNPGAATLYAFREGLSFDETHQIVPRFTGAR